MQETKLSVASSGAGDRVDRWLSRRLPGLSRSRIQSLIKAGDITVGGRCVKAHYRLDAGMQVRIAIPEPEATSLIPEDIPLQVLYEDTHIIVVNKPAGIVVHPAAGHPSGTLVNALLGHCRDLAGIGGELRPGIVHRLDKNTSGALVVAKNEKAMAGLMQQFKQGKVRKEYLAVVWGRIDPARGRLETCMGRSLRDRKKMSVRTVSGRTAVTNYDTVEVFRDVSLLRVRIETGRTHQIRVHLSYLGHPVVGDRQYGGKPKAGLPRPAGRQMLHAEKLMFEHPDTGRPVSFVAPLPDDMRELLEGLRDQASRGASLPEGMTSRGL